METQVMISLQDTGNFQVAISKGNNINRTSSSKCSLAENDMKSLLICGDAKEQHITVTSDSDFTEAVHIDIPLELSSFFSSDSVVVQFDNDICGSLDLFPFSSIKNITY